LGRKTEVEAGAVENSKAVERGGDMKIWIDQIRDKAAGSCEMIREGALPNRIFGQTRPL
jgi:hypothetical protein